MTKCVEKHSACCFINGIVINLRKRSPILNAEQISFSFLFWKKNIKATTTTYFSVSLCVCQCVHGILLILHFECDCVWILMCYQHVRISFGSSQKKTQIITNRKKTSRRTQVILKFCECSACSRASTPSNANHFTNALQIGTWHVSWQQQQKIPHLCVSIFRSKKKKTTDLIWNFNYDTGRIDQCFSILYCVYFSIFSLSLFLCVIFLFG